MPVQKCTARLSERIELGSKFQHLFFEMSEPNTLEFQAGQYVSVGFPDNPARRPYSICSEPDKTHGFELLVDTKPQGIGTKYLSNLPLGDEMSILAPMGMFTLATGEQAAKEKALVFIATGSGIAPFRSMILDLLHKGDTREIWLYWGLRHVEDIFWQEDFHEMDTNFANFNFHLTLSQATDDWPLCRGRVTDCLRIHELPTNSGYYLCGNSPMIQEVSTILLEEKKIPKDNVHFEKFY